ncbi:MAG: ADP-glyceromanno-heptose 6-epimerase [Bacteroidetes bacterium GWA2_31_9]|nr:MAG: ADP-glyceromanno-heptose 6-epimerase [Bacteroidetes bacterium GWA2_31_9]
MKVLITGGAGYIGTELTIQLEKETNVNEIIIYDNLSRNNYNIFLHSRIKRGKVKFIKGDILDSRKLKEILKDIDVVYHLAARVTTPFSNESPHLFEQVNNWGTAELVYAVEDSNVKKFIYVSSSSVYGSSDNKVDINTFPNPETFYGISKLQGEKHVERLFNKIDTYIIRSGNVYGFGVSMRFDAVINKFMFDASFTGRISVNGNGKQHRAFVHVDKLVDVLKNINLSGYKSGIYNLVDKNISVIELSDLIKDIYPDIEMIFINQHLKLRELIVIPDDRLQKLISIPEKNLREEFEEFSIKFHNSSIE